MGRRAHAWRPIAVVHRLRLACARGHARDRSSPARACKSVSFRGMSRDMSSAAERTAEASAPRVGRPSIINPTVDLLLVGGLSLVVFIPLLLSGRSDLVFIGAGAQAFLA